MYAIALCVVIVLLLAWVVLGRESFRSCRGCDGVMSARGTAVLNPFVWPYSATECVDDVYILNKDAGVDVGLSVAPLTHLSTPDHVEMVG